MAEEETNEATSTTTSLPNILAHIAIVDEVPSQVEIVLGNVHVHVHVKDDDSTNTNTIHTRTRRRALSLGIIGIIVVAVMMLAIIIMILGTTTATTVFGTIGTSILGTVQAFLF